MLGLIDIVKHGASTLSTKAIFPGRSTVEVSLVMIGMVLHSTSLA